MDGPARIANFVAFQAGWFACVLSGAHGWNFVAPPCIAAVIGIHLWLVDWKKPEILLLLACGFGGTLIDSILFNFGVIGFPNGSWAPLICPFWFSGLWVNFGTTLNGCLSWLQGRYWIGAALGALGGPTAYYAGARLGAMTLGKPLGESLAVIAIEYAIVVPLLLLLSSLLREPVRETAGAAAAGSTS